MGWVAVLALRNVQSSTRSIYLRARQTRQNHTSLCRIVVADPASELAQRLMKAAWHPGLRGGVRLTRVELGDGPRSARACPMSRQF